eukprot:scaffold32256_cov69-Phaeocystis_antarctica.AAC.3
MNEKPWFLTPPPCLGYGGCDMYRLEFSTASIRSRSCMTRLGFCQCFGANSFSLSRSRNRCEFGCVDLCGRMSSFEGGCSPSQPS